MESKQTAQMVSWLDEERRKDKALIVKLEERNSAQASLLEDQSRRLQAIENELSTVRASSISLNQFDETISRLRTEMSNFMEQSEKRTQSSEKDPRKLQETVRDIISKAIDDVRQEIFGRMERELQPRRAEEERLSRVAVELQNYADSLSKNLDEFQRTLTFLEENRRQDSRRLSDILGEQSEIGKRLDSTQAKAELLEDLSRRNERSLGDLTGVVQEMKQQRQAQIEQESVATQQREKAMSDLMKRIEDSMKTLSKQAEQWGDTHRTMKKQVDDFERIADRVDRRLNEVSEIQRISEERFRKEWEEFQQEDQKRFRQFTLTNDEAWRENEKLTKSFAEQIARLTEVAELNSEQLRTLNTTQLELLDRLATSILAAREQSQTIKVK
jgi:hypothetical protein